MAEQLVEEALISRKSRPTLKFFPAKLRDFIHKMNFKKTKGFELGEKVNFPK